MRKSDVLNPAAVKGRGAQTNTHNSFESLEYYMEPSIARLDNAENKEEIKTRFLSTHPKTIVNKVESPDIGLYYSLNPYQGCEHGCIYCYARNTHNYWGYSAGLDFETTILIKENAPELLDKLLSSKRWEAAPIMLSGNTDCYQPIERKAQITRKLLEVFLKHKHPVGIITKNDLILRDLDIIKKLNADNLVNVAISINTIDDGLRKKLEPRASSVSKRLDLIRKLSEENIPVTAMAAPIIPGINDSDILPLAKRVALAGARRLNHIVVRLNGDVGELFTDWLQVHYEDRKDKVLNKIKSTHGGQLNDSRFGIRMKGEGIVAEMISKQFTLAKKLYLLDTEPFTYNLDLYKLNKTKDRTLQLSLF